MNSSSSSSPSASTASTSSQQQQEFKAFLIIRDSDRKEVHRVGLSHLDEIYVEKVMSGMLRNMRDDLFIDDSEVDVARRQEKS